MMHTSVFNSVRGPMVYNSHKHNINNRRQASSKLIMCSSHGHSSKRHSSGPFRRASAKPSFIQRDTPIRRYLRSTLALKEPMLDQLSALCADEDLNSLSDDEVKGLVDPNVELLGHLASADKVKTVVCRNPRLLLAPISSWYSFCQAYCELEGQQFWKLVTHPTLMRQGSVFRAGRAIMFLRENGWTDLEIKSLVFPYHAAILQMDDQQQLRPVLQHLVDCCGMSSEAAKQFLHQHPHVLYTEDYKPQVQQLLRKQRQLALQTL